MPIRLLSTLSLVAAMVISGSAFADAKEGRSRDCP